MPSALNRPARLLPALLCALCLLGVAPAGAQAFSKAIWGDVYHNGVNQFPLYQKLGVKIYEADLDWSVVAQTKPAHATNPNDPAYHWPKQITQAVRMAKRYHMQVLLLVATTPRWASGRSFVTAPPRRPIDYANFMAAASKRYPSVRLWMVWGEPTRTANFSLTRNVPWNQERLSAAQKAAPHFYARMLDASYGALKRIRKSNLVIGGCTFVTGSIDTKDWIENLRLPDGKAPRMDMYAHNPFSARDPSFSAPFDSYGEVDFSDLPELGHWIDHYLHRNLPIFLSEFTIPTAIDQEFDFYVDPPVAGKWTSDALRLARRWHRIYGLGWIHVYDDPPASNGGLLTVSGTPKPDYYAFMHG